MKGRNYLIGLALLLMWFAIPTQIKAFTPVEATVKSKGINVRSHAGTDSSVVTGLPAGSKIQVYDAVNGKDGHIWYVVYINGKTRGFVRGDLIAVPQQKAEEKTETKTETKKENKTETQKETPKETNTKQESTTQQNSNTSTQGTTVEKGSGKVNGTGVRVRSLTSTSSAVVTTVKKNKKVTLLNKATGADAKTWYQVSFKQDGKKIVGYIRADLIKIVKDVSVTKKDAETNNQKNESQNSSSVTASTGAVKGINVNVRMKPVDGVSICKLSTNHSVSVLSETTGSDKKVWLYIQFTYGNVVQEGYIRSDFVIVEKKKEPDSSTENTQTESEDTKDTKKSATIKGVNVRIRKSAVNGTVLCQQSTGFALTVVEEVAGSDEKTWYKVSYIYNEKEETGYVRCDFVQFVEEAEVKADEAFENAMTEQAFPESYKGLLRQRHEKQPTWVFKAVHTGLDWNTAVKEESKVGRNFVPKNSIVSYKSLEKTAYSYKDNKWYTFDGGSWVAASQDVVAYYMDPRNFLTEAGVYQFETLEYKDYQTKEGVASMLASTFMKGDYEEPDGTRMSYADTFVEVGQTLGVNPYHLAARCYQEQGTGKSGSISGKVKGYENIFNYFHIGAYASGNHSPVTQGLIYASKTDEKYQRPWNTRYKSILGGSTYLAIKYIKVGQNTLYFQKFNVVNTKNGIYSHQYMTNLMAASSEATRMKKAYSDADMAMEFVIPVYNNMPDTACAKPTANENPNNYLKSLSVKNYKMNPTFDGGVTEYYLTVDSDVEEIKVSSEAVAKTSTVSGTGTVALSKGMNTINVVCRSASGENRTYTIYVTRNE